MLKVFPDRKENILDYKPVSAAIATALQDEKAPTCDVKQDYWQLRHSHLINLEVMPSSQLSMGLKSLLRQSLDQRLSSSPIYTGPLTLERLQVSIPDLPLRLRGLRIVQLSDLHFDGIRLNEAMLAQAIATTNAQSPDLICLTGDFVNSQPELIHRLTPQLQKLRSTYGTYAVLGNHDLLAKRSRQVITQALEQSCITVLWNDITYPWGEGFALVGLPDFWARDFAPAPVLAQLSPDLPRLVLSHNPDSAEVLKDWRVDLQLSGHSHGGQINLPLLGVMPKYFSAIYLNMPTQLQPHAGLLGRFSRVMSHWEWARGFHQLQNNLGGQNQLYVNRGLGSYWPGRSFCPPEITVIQLI